MARPSQKPILTQKDEAILTQRSRSKTEEHRAVERAKIVLMSAEAFPTPKSPVSSLCAAILLVNFVNS